MERLPNHEAMIDPKVCARMREDWNARAQEDANYYVAFGRRGQPLEEFFDTANEVAVSIARELKRLPPSNRLRALEIGCGPGRLIRPLSSLFGEIHGVDVSDAMVRLARERLQDLPNVYVHATSGADLAPFASDSFDLVYSYAVFQHIPSEEVVFQYLRESRRVLKTGGILRCQINGLPETAARYDTWNGVRISAGKIAAFAERHDFQLLALEGVETQYMWVTMRKRPQGWSKCLAATPPPEGIRIRRITSANSSEPGAPPVGRFAAISIWVEGMPEDCDINHMGVWVGGRRAFCTYMGPEESGALRQVNALLPAGLSTGLQLVEMRWGGAPVGPAATLRVIPPPPAVPRIVSVTDGINLLCRYRTETGTVKVTLEEAVEVDRLRASVGGLPVYELDTFCTDPRVPRHEVNFRISPGLKPGTHELIVQLGKRLLRAPLTVAG